MIDHLIESSIRHWDKAIRVLGAAALSRLVEHDPSYFINHVLPQLVSKYCASISYCWSKKVYDRSHSLLQETCKYYTVCFLPLLKLVWHSSHVKWWIKVQMTFGHPMTSLARYMLLWCVLKYIMFMNDIFLGPCKCHQGHSSKIAWYFWIRTHPWSCLSFDWMFVFGTSALWSRNTWPLEKTGLFITRAKGRKCSAICSGSIQCLFSNLWCWSTSDWCLPWQDSIVTYDLW